MMRKSTAKKMRADREAYLLRRHKEALEYDVCLAAVHEAGHALAYTLLRNGVEYASVERKVVEHNSEQALSSGFTQPQPRKLSRETIEEEAVCVLAGPAAEDRYNGAVMSGSQGDLDSLRDYAISVGLSRDEAVALTGRAYRSACELVDMHFDAVKQIAFELMTKGRIEGDGVNAIVQNASK